VNLPLKIYQQALCGVYGTLLRVSRALLGVCRALSCVDLLFQLCIRLLMGYMSLFCGVYVTLLRVCRALLSVCTALLFVDLLFQFYIRLFVGYMSLFCEYAGLF